MIYIGDILRSYTHVRQISYIDCYSCRNNQCSCDSNLDAAAVDCYSVDSLDISWEDHIFWPPPPPPPPPPPLPPKGKSHPAIYSGQFPSASRRVCKILCKAECVSSFRRARQPRAARVWHGQSAHRSSSVDG